MANQIGRCNNLELCTVGVSQRLISVPADAPFVCDKCGEPLTAPGSTALPRRRTASILIQAVVVLAGLGALTWKLAGPDRDFAPIRGLVTASAPPATAPIVVAEREPQPTPTPAILTQAIPTPTNATPANATPPNAAPATVEADAPSSAATPSVAAADPVAAAANEPPAPVASPALAATPATLPAVPVTPAATRAAVPTVVLLRLAGSDAVAPKLIRRLASSYLALIGDTSISAAPNSISRQVDVSGLQTGQREVISILETSSAGGFNALLRGNTDMVVSNRKLTSAEADQLKSVGDLTLAAHEHVIAVQGIALIVHPTNRITALTVGQIQSILSGRLTNWSEVGGLAGPIKLQVLAVPEDGGDTPQDAIISPDTLSAAVIRSPSEQAVAARVVSDRDSLGIVTAGATGAAKVLAIADGSAPPTLPTELTLASETYPFSQRIYLYGVNGGNGFIRRFADYVSSANGQAAVEAAGYISLAIKTETAAAPDIASDRYKQLVQGATRMSVDFRFQPGSVDLDSRGARDMDRVIAFLKSQRVPANKIVLAAFADNSGQAATNQAVSQRRAESVASALARGGFTPGKIASFGSELPVADNATPEGRERNRRVEVYLVP